MAGWGPGNIFGDWTKGDFLNDEGPAGSIRDGAGQHAHDRDNQKYGTFWRGQDGKVWVAGDKGVHSAGRWDNNTHEYWQTRGYRLQNDPKRMQGGGRARSTAEQDYPDLRLGAYDGGGGGNRASAAQLREYEQGIDETNHNLGRIDNQLAIRRANTQDAWQKKMDTLNSSIDRAKSQYDANKTQNMQQRRNEINLINDQASGDLQRLLRTLGARGAGGSDIEKVARAVQDKANRERSGSSTMFAKNAQEYDRNWFTFNQDAEKERKGINDWKVNEERAAERDAETQRQGLRSFLGKLKSQQAEARGANGANAARADLAAARALSGKIDELGRIQTTHTGKDPVYQAKPLDSYKVGGSTAVGVTQADGPATDTTANVYATKQAEEDERKKRNQWL